MQKSNFTEATSVESKRESKKLRAFISYSRQDLEFAMLVVDALSARDIDALIDKKNLPLLEDWERELTVLIQDAEAVIFIVSPASLASPVCQWEVDQVKALRKRLAPISLIPEAQLREYEIPTEVRKYNFVFFDNPGDFEKSADDLAAALNRDGEWWREHARLVGLAVRWRDAGRPSDELLRGTAITSADQWAGRRPDNVRIPPDVFFEFVHESRERQNKDDLVLRQTIGRTFVLPSLRELDNGFHDRALRLAAAGAIRARDISLDPRVDTRLAKPLLRSIIESRAQAVLHGHSTPVTSSEFSPDGRYIITRGLKLSSQNSGYPTIVWDAISGAQVPKLQAATADVSQAVFSTDSQSIITASNDGSARIWDIATGRQLSLFADGPKRVNSVSLSPDGRHLLTASADGAMNVWDVKTRSILPLFNDSRFKVLYAKYSPDGQQILSVHQNNSIRIWSAITGQHIAVLGRFNDIDSVVSASYSLNGQRIVTSSVGKVTIWQASTGEQISRLKGRTHVVTALITPDALQVATFTKGTTGYADTFVRIWDATTGKLISILKGHERVVTGASFSPDDGSRIVTSSEDMTARIWDASTGKELAVLNGHSHHVNSASFSPDGNRVVTSSRDQTARIWDASIRQTIIITNEVLSSNGSFYAISGKDKTVQIKDAESGRLVSTLRAHKRKVVSTAFSPDERCAVTASRDRTARVWDVNTGQQLALLGHSRQLQSAEFSPTGKKILTLAQDKIVRIFDAETGTLITPIKCDAGFSRAFFTDDEKYVVASSEDKKIRFWNPLTGHQANLDNREDPSVRGRYYSPDRKVSITSYEDENARLWCTETGREIAFLGPHQGVVSHVSFSRDSRYFCTVTTMGLAGRNWGGRIWHAESGTPISTFEGHADKIWSADFSIDGSRLVTASDDRTARIWDVLTGQQLEVLKGHSDSVRSARFSVSGMRVITKSDDQTMRLWDVSRSSLVNQPRSLLLTAALAHGLGWRPESEAVELLAQTGTEDLFVEAVDQLGIKSDNVRLEAVISILNRARHSNCYLSSAQFWDKFPIAYRRNRLAISKRLLLLGAFLLLVVWIAFY